MKISKLLVLSTLSLFSLSVSAADLITREEPVKPEVPEDAPTLVTSDILASIDKTAAQFEVGKYYVIYNLGAQKYFSQGNNWGTRASVSDNPILVRFSYPNGILPSENTLLLNDYCIKNKAWKLAFFDSETYMYVDRGSQANYFWQVVSQGDNVYRLQASPTNPSLNPKAYPGYVGQDPKVEVNNSNNTSINLENTYPLSPFMQTGNIDWVFYEVTQGAEYAQELTAYETALNAYTFSSALKTQIEAAEAEGIDVAEAVAVYNNLYATAEDIDNATVALMTARLQQEAEGASLENPVDLTAQMLVNPTYDSNATTGWSGSSPGYGSGAAEFFNTTFNYYQKVRGAAKGVYTVKVQGFYRAGDGWANVKDAYSRKDVRNVKLFTAVGEDTIYTNLMNAFDDASDQQLGIGGDGGERECEGLWIPNNMEGAAGYFSEGHYVNSLVFGVDNGGSVNIGLFKTVGVGSDWTMFDNWSVEYVGAEPEAWQYWVSGVKAALDLPTDGYTAAYMEALGAIDTNVSDYEEANTAVTALREAFEALTLNVSLWQQLSELREKALGFVADARTEQKPDGKYDPTLCAQLNRLCQEAQRAIAQRQWLNEDIQEKIDAINAQILKVQLTPVGSDIDMTELLTNPDFSTGDFTGWVKTGGSGNYAVGSNCAEAWNSSEFDLHQTVEGAPVGVYRISVQGFYRYGRGDVAWNAYMSQTVDYVKPGGAPVFIYLNSKKTPFMNVYDEFVQADTTFYTSGYQEVEDGLYQFPNTMASAAEAFALGKYTQSAYGLVQKQGDSFTVGVTGVSNQLGDSWVIFDNFKLTFMGFDAQVVGEVLESEVTNKEAVLETAIGKSVYAMVQEKIDEAKALLTKDGEGKYTANGSVMFEKLNELFELDDTIRASQAVMAELTAAMKKLNDAMAKYENTCSETAMGLADALYEDIDGRMEEHDIDDSEVEDLIKQINDAIVDLKIPDIKMDVNDDNPYDMTLVIESYDYSTNTGWSQTAGHNTDLEVAELFSETGAAYNYYQDLSVPAGTYEVSVQAFYRFGLPDVDYKAKDSIGTSCAYLYAIGADSVVSSVALKRLYMAAQESSYLDEGWAWAVPYVEFKEATYYAEGDSIPEGKNVGDVKEPAVEEQLGIMVPNTMTTAAAIFAEENDEDFDGEPVFTENRIITKVGADKKLRIGLVKNSGTAKDWTFFDNWKLIYYGENSAKEISDDPSAVKSAKTIGTVKVERFSVAGNKVSAAQRGLVIEKRILSDGTVQIRKTYRK